MRGRKEGKKEDRKTEEGAGRWLSGSVHTQPTFGEERQKTQNKKKSGEICDVLTGIPASKATAGSEGKQRARGSLPH